MKSASKIVAFLTAVAVIGVAAYGAYWALTELWHLYSRAGDDFKLGVLTAFVSLFGVVWSVIYQRRKELLALQFERKREAYGAFFDLFFDFLDAGKRGVDPVLDQSFQDKWTNLTKSLMVWGGARTINAFNAFQAGSVVGEDIKESSARIEKLMREFRADLGHKDTQLKPYALTKLIVKGDEHHKFDV